MITTGIDKRVKVQQIIQNQLPEFVLSESPKAVDFLKQYYISQEYQGGPMDLTDNLDQYIKLDNLTPEVVVGETKLTSDISINDTTVNVLTTKGFPNEYGLFKIENEIITYTGITTNSFTGCIRGFSGITTYHAENEPNELVFSDSSATNHDNDDTVINLSALFLKEFYKKTKKLLTPGLENSTFVDNLDVSNFIKNSKSLYQSKGTEESFRILFNVLYNETPIIVDLERYLIKPSSAEFIRREIVLAEVISGNPINLIGQTIVKSTDSQTRAAISEVEPLTRDGKVYYKIGLFVGFNEVDLIEGTFNVSGKTKVIGNVSIGSTVITVDSTVGFGQTGILVSGISTNIYYNDKSVNQFFGCENIVSNISSTDDIRSDEFYYGYEGGDLTKKVELRLTGVLSKFVPTSDISLLNQGEKISVRNVGEKILNPENDKTKKQIFANSWIYNTSSRFKVESISGANFVLFTRDIDKSSIKIGDNVEILFRNEEEVVATGTVGNIDQPTGTISVNNLTNQPGITQLPDPNREYDLRRVINRSTSTITPIEFGNSILTTDVTNVYNESNENFYVASNSLPSYQITAALPKSVLPDAQAGIELPQSGYDANTLKYSIISFQNPVPFITGDEIFYTAQGDILPGLPESAYFVEVLSSTNQIRLYKSRSFIPIQDFVEFEALPTGSGTHTFSLVGIKEQEIAPQKLFKKFPLNPSLTNSSIVSTTPGTTGMLVNGVEITNYKSNDKIFYGPLESISLLNGGKNYDVLNPPNITLTGPGAGSTNALIRPVVTGSISDVLVDPQDFDIKRVISTTIEGGNGSGVILEPILQERNREISFDARLVSESGGIDNINETLTFSTNHNIESGQALVYDRNNNPPLGIGTVGNDAGTSAVGVGTTTLINTATYYPSVINPTTIKLYQTLGDYSAGINTVGFTTTNKIGIHKFKLLEGKNNLKDIRVINSGSGYENRQVFVKPIGINTVTNTIHFDNHGFKQGDKIVYSTAVGVGSTIPTTISGLTTYTGITTTSNFYQVIKINDDSFRIASAGLGGTITSEYERNDYIKFPDHGTGFQIFKYPDVKLNLKYELSNTSVGVITATPVVRGEITDVLLYEKGTNYGSDILNLEKSITINVKTGKNAQLKPIVTNGKISYVEIQTKGQEYTSAPDLEVVGIGTGLGAKLRAVVTGGQITDVIVVDGGLQYQQDNVDIKITPPGSGAKLETRTRGLTVNSFVRYGDEALIETNNKLEYSIVGYSTQIGNDTFGDTGSQHSPIIGWSYDGNPIYGPYGFSNFDDINSPVRILKTGYTLDTSNIVNRPLGFSNGFFIDDFKFDNSGDLDEYNGRYCRTPEYPNGIYAYFVGITTNSLLPKFPYFIGNSYRSNPITENFNINQNTFDFDNSDLIRNSYPYKVSDANADNDFIIESNEITTQSALVENTTSGSISSVDIINAGDNYEVGDAAIFDNTNTNGGGLSVSVNSISGKEITSIDTTVNTFENVVFVYASPNTVSAYISTAPSLNNNDNVVISGLSTTGIKNLAGSQVIGITTVSTIVYKDIPIPSSTGIVTDIYVSKIPNFISVGSSIGIGTEKLLVLNTFDENNILRVRRGVTTGVHTASSKLSLIPSYFDIDVKTDYFDSRVNDIVYFNPHESIGVGTVVGLGSTAFATRGDIKKIVSTPTHSIFLPNHPFTTNQKVTLTKPTVGYALTVSKDNGVTTFNLPEVGITTEVYVIRKSNDYIGIVTQVGLTTSSDGLAFFGDSKVGSSNFEYKFESNFDQVTGKLQRIDSVVSVSTSHNLVDGDVINLELTPSESVGIGTSTSINVKFDNQTNNLLINPVKCTTSGVTTSSNNFNIDSHNLQTGSKVQYDSSSVSEGLVNKESYYIYKVDDNNFKLGETYSDVTSNPANIINLKSTGNNHEFSLINPPIPVYKNNNLVFNVQDSSLFGYELEIYHDKDFKNEFISVGNTSNFQVTGVGTVGINTTATVTLNFYDKNPSNLFYNIKKSGFISTSDTDVVNHNKIHYLDSKYSGEYTIFNVPPVVGASYTSFSISIPEVPEKLSYTSSDTSSLKYSTKSSRARGSINEINIDFAGVGYDDLPSFVSIGSTQGTNATLLPNSTTINRVDNVRILNPGFEYSSDPTLKPEAFISPVISVINSNTISNIEVIDGGKNYTTIPDLVVVDPLTGQEDTSGALIGVDLIGSSLANVEIIVAPKGLKSITHEIFAINNTNGSTVSNLQYNQATGIATCTLTTPILGFSTAPFSVDDEIYVEGLQKNDTTGTGFNSADNGYKFFKVTAFNNTNPATVEFSLASVTSNAGIAKTNQNSFGVVISKNDYPIFKVTQKVSRFGVGEKLLAFVGSSYVPVDLIVSESSDDLIKIEEVVPGAFNLTAGQLIRGFNTGNIATINTISKNSGIFEISYSLKENQGWNNDIGKLNQDYQVTPDNDYYQNLSYSIKSSITYEDLVNPVNRLLHTTGLKNFADVGITSITNVGITTSSFTDVLALDFIDQKRVDTINNFDFAIDIDTFEGKSKFLKLKNTKLSPYIECRTNRVLEIDDISGLFSNTASSLSEFLDLSINTRYATFLVQVINPNNNNTQLSDIILYKDDTDVFTAERAKIHTTPSELGEIKGEIDSSDNISLKFIPDDPDNNDYDLKILKTSYNTNLSGIGTQSIGFINLSGINTTVSVATTSTIISTNIDNTDAFFASIEVNNTFTEQTNFVELYLTHDGTNSFISEFYADTEDGPTSNFIGTFSSEIESGVLSLNFENDQSNDILVRSRVIGIGTTATGIGTYRFKLPGQIDGTERTTVFESKYHNVSTASTIATFTENVISSLKGFVRVSSGSTSALHQVLVAHDSTDTHTTQYPFISIGSTSGIGTFSSTIVGNDLCLNFHPDPLYSGGTNSVEVQSFTEAFYSETDLLNIPPDLQYGTVTESLSFALYDAINGSRSNKTSFVLQSDSKPIFQKQFNPSDTGTLDAATGVFTIIDHFFETGERLIYTPGSTFTGISLSGIATAGGTLGSEVYAIRVDKDSIKIAKSRANALAGVAVTFTGTGTGNAHEFEMFKKNEKALMSIDGVIQSPMAFTPLTTGLEYNITTNATTFSVTGISSITSDDIIKVNNEFMKITNVGLGTTSVGPITNTGSVKLFTVERGAIGTAATTHSSGATARLFSGGYNIVDSTVHFTNPPRGTNSTQKTPSNLDPVRSKFNGRVFLRQDYTNNRIFDDISNNFTGIGQTFDVKVNGSNTTGIQTGSSILLLNGIFQTPSTFNNLGNNYEYSESGSVSKVTFTGITSTNGTRIISDTDVNQNQLPRGGVIVSLGSTGGLGVANLAPAKVKPTVGAGGTTIVGICGIATAGDALGINTISFNNVTGQLEVTTSKKHKFREINEFVRFDGLVFNPTLTIPSDRSFSITGITSEKTFTTDIGVSTQTHAYVGSGTVFEYFPDLSFGSGYRNPVSVAVTDIAYEHKFVSAATGAITGTGGPFTPTNAIYESHTGLLTLTIPNHGRSSGNIQIVENSLTFTCSRDYHKTNHTYPRSTDPAGGSANLPITVIDVNTISVNVGPGGGAGTGAVVTAEVVPNTHVFVSAATNAVSVTGGSPLTPTGATYDPATGNLVITKASHGLTTSDTVGLATNSFVFRCAQDNFETTHSYPRSGPTPSSAGGDPAHNATLAITAKTTNTFTVNVGITNTGTGGALKFNISSVGQGYVTPSIQVSAPSYQNLPITGVSRRGIGATTDTGTGATLTIGVGAANTSVGIGSTSYKVTNFTLNNTGYDFKVGDVFKPVGLVTDRFLNTSQLISDFELTVLEVFRDQYSSWNFGEFDYIDSIKDLQNGQRKRFPLIYNSNLLSFEVDTDNPNSSLIDLDALLLIFVNGVVQDPGESYTFEGGTSFEFTQAPDGDDNIDIFFYKGTSGVDAVQVAAGSSVAPTIKTGDVVQVFKDTSGITTTQEQRTIYNITASDEVETNLYTQLGVDERNYKPFSWIKQKVDKKVNGEIVYKTRDSLESQVYPTGKIIGDLSTTDTELFVDNSKFFNYEEDYSALTNIIVGGLIVGATEPVSAAFTATVSIGGTIQALTITNPGSGYVGSTTSISISAPSVIGVGVGVTATATATITNGVITNTTITNPGLGYTISAVPQVLTQLPRVIKEDIDQISSIEGYDGIIKDIAVTEGVGGHPLALKFTLEPDLANNPNSVAGDLKVGYPIMIFGTKVGHGVTSVDGSNSTVVATGTTCLDNIYIINDYVPAVGIITCNIMTGVNTSGINGATVGFGTGMFSWGRLSGFTRGTNPVSIGVTGLTIDSGLTTYPSIQRRDFGLRDNGSLRKDLG